MPVISNEKCVKQHAYWNKTIITSNMICAQGFNIPLNFISIPTLMAQHEIFLLIFKPQKAFQIKWKYGTNYKQYAVFTNIFQKLGVKLRILSPNILISNFVVLSYDC